MVKTSLLQLIVAALFGAGLGLFFFGGLWLTIGWLRRVSQPAVLLLASLLVRGTVTLACFWLVMAGRWERLAACLGGFLLARVILVRRWRPWLLPGMGGRE